MRVIATLCCVVLALAIGASASDHDTCRTSFTGADGGSMDYEVIAPKCAEAGDDIKWSHDSLDNSKVDTAVGRCDMCVMTLKNKDYWAPKTLGAPSSGDNWNQDVSVQIYRASCPSGSCMYLSANTRVANYCFQIHSMNPLKGREEECFHISLVKTDQCKYSKGRHCIHSQLQWDSKCRASWEGTLCKADTNADCFADVKAHIETSRADPSKNLWYRAKMRRYLNVQMNQDFHRRRAMKANQFVPMIDAGQYFAEVFTAIMTAKKSIALVGFKFNPDIRLVHRDDPTKAHYTLINAIRTRMKKVKNFKVYIIMYHSYNKGTLDQEGPNNLDEASLARFEALNDEEGLARGAKIDVNRHGSYGWDSTVFFSHHSKFIVVDNGEYGFVGGCDLATDPARYDTPEHELPPVGPTVAPAQPLPDAYDWRRDDTLQNYPLLENGQPRTSRSRPSNPIYLWHDLAAKVTNPEYAMDLWRLFLVRHLANTQEKTTVDANDFLLSPTNKLYFTGSKYIYRDLIYEGYNENKPAVARHLHDGAKPNEIFCTLVFSLGPWSGLPQRRAGLGEITDDSFFRTWRQVISEAKHFIYIEQQYLISRGGMLNEYDNIKGTYAADLNNDLSIRILERIQHAHKKNQQFHVVIVMPYKADANQAGMMKRTVKFMMESVELMTGGDSREYITFYGLRKFRRSRKLGVGLPGTNIDTTDIYLHDKLLITDSRRLVLGSANINDRSMRGSRDSETGIYVEDYRESDENYAFDLMKKLLAEHTGMFLDDPFPTTREAELSWYRGVFRTLITKAHYNDACFDAINPGPVMSTDSMEPVSRYFYADAAWGAQKPHACDHDEVNEANKLISWPIEKLYPDTYTYNHHLTVVGQTAAPWALQTLIETEEKTANEAMMSIRRARAKLTNVDKKEKESEVEQEAEQKKEEKEEKKEEQKEEKKEKKEEKKEEKKKKKKEKKYKTRNDLPAEDLKLESDVKENTISPALKELELGRLRSRPMPDALEEIVLDEDQKEKKKKKQKPKCTDPICKPLLKKAVDLYKKSKENEKERVLNVVMEECSEYAPACVDEFYIKAGLVSDGKTSTPDVDETSGKGLNIKSVKEDAKDLTVSAGMAATTKLNVNYFIKKLKAGSSKKEKKPKKKGSKKGDEKEEKEQDTESTSLKIVDKVSTDEDVAAVFKKEEEHLARLDRTEVSDMKIVLDNDKTGVNDDRSRADIAHEVKKEAVEVKGKGKGDEQKKEKEEDVTV